MATRLGGSMYGIGAGLAEGLSSATKTMTDIYKTDVEENLANKRIDALNAQTDLARNADTRAAEKWGMEKDKEARLDEIIPIDQAKKLVSIPEAGDYLGGVAEKLGYVKDGGIRRRDALSTIEFASKDPLHMNELSRLTMNHWQ